MSGSTKVSATEEIKKKQEEKLVFEVSYIGNTILSTMSYLDLAKDPRTEKLIAILDEAHSEIARLKADGLKY